MPLTKDQIMGHTALVVEPLDIPQWGGTSYIRLLSGTERDAFELSNQKTLLNVRARLAAACLCDEQGKRLFTDIDAVALGKLSGAALDRVFDAAQRLNVLSDRDIQELEGN